MRGDSLSGDRKWFGLGGEPPPAWRVEPGVECGAIGEAVQHCVVDRPVLVQHGRAEMAARGSHATTPATHRLRACDRCRPGRRIARAPPRIDQPGPRTVRSLGPRSGRGSRTGMSGRAAPGGLLTSRARRFRPGSHSSRIQSGEVRSRCSAPRPDRPTTSSVRHAWPTGRTRRSLGAT